MLRDDKVRRSLITLRRENQILYEFLRWVCSRFPDGSNDVGCDLLDLKWSYATHTSKFSEEMFYSIANALIKKRLLSSLEPDDRPPVVIVSREVMRHVIAIEMTEELGASS